MPEKTAGAERLHYPPRSGVPFFKTRKSSFEEQRHGAVAAEIGKKGEVHCVATQRNRQNAGFPWV